MDDLQREKILGLRWECMSLAANGEDIPMSAQLKADEIEEEISKLISEPAEDSC
jgi:hypothetical protein